jgi:hypothetical protein
MNNENLGRAFEKLVKNLVGDKYGIEIDFEPVEHFEGKPYYDVIVYLDPNKYHWVGSEYSKKYHEVMEDIEYEIEKALKYIGGHTWEYIHNVKFERTKDSDNFYNYLKEKIKEIWPKVRSSYLEKTNPYIIPDIIDIKIGHQGQFDDITIIVDTAHVHPSYYDRGFWHMFFVYTSENGVELDTFRVDIKGYED